VRSADDRHALLVYHDQDLRWNEVAAFAERGLERGELVTCTAAAGDCTFEEGLAARGVDVAAATQAGQLRRLSLAELFAHGGMTGYVTDALQRGYSGVRLCGNAASSTAHLGRQGMHAAELEMNHLCESLPVAALCQYDAVAGTADETAELVAAHPQLVRSDALLVTRGGAQVRLAGELDLSSAPVLEAALERAAADGGGTRMVVDLAELTFMDLAGHDALMRGTERVRADGGALVVRGAADGVLRLLDALGMRGRGDVLFV